MKRKTAYVLRVFVALMVIMSMGLSLAPASAQPACNPSYPDIWVCQGDVVDEAFMIAQGVGCDDPEWDIASIDISQVDTDVCGDYPYSVSCVDINYPECTCGPWWGVLHVECPCEANAPDFEICVGETVNEALFLSNGVSCPGDDCSLVGIDSSGVNSAVAGVYDYTVTCTSSVCGDTSADGQVTVVDCNECDCTAPDIVICQGDPVDDDLFLNAGAGCCEGTEPVLDYSMVNSSVPGDYQYSVYCEGSEMCFGFVTVLPACMATASDFDICQGTGLTTGLFDQHTTCSTGCERIYDWSQVNPSVPGCYPYSVSCIDPCGGDCGADMAEATICVIPCVDVEIIECGGMECLDGCPGDGIVPVSSYTVVKAVITNCSGCILYDVTPYIIITGNAELVDMPDHWNLGNMEAGDSTEVAWTLHCTAPGPVDVEVWVNDCATDTCGYDQRIPGELAVTCTSPCEVCVNCDMNEFTVDAVVTNIGQTAIADAEAKITWTGPANVELDYTIDLGTIGPGGSMPVSWNAECTGEGPVTFTITVNGYDICANAELPPVTCTTTTEQRSVTVDVCSIPGGACSPVCSENLIVSRLQPFAVEATVQNCSDVATPMVVTLTLPEGSQLTGEKVKIYCPELGTTTLVTANTVINLPNVCDCCSAVITWPLECIAPTGGWVPVEVTVEAFQNTYSNFPCNEAYLWQEEKVHLAASMGAFVEECDSDCMMPVEVVGVCQDFDVKIWVENSGEAVAQNVMMDILVSGPTSCAGTYPDVLFAPTIDGGTTEWSWLSELIALDCHCIEEGDVTVTIMNLRGIDENTCEPVLEENIEQICPLVIPQCDIQVAIINPIDQSSVDQWEKFAVKARITNCGECTFEDMAVTLLMSGDVELVDGSMNPVIIPVIEAPDEDCEEECRVYEVSWMLQCVGAPDTVTLDVCIESMTPHLQRKSETVTVYQQERDTAHVCVEILSPDCGSIYATSQDFAITAKITNMEECAPITIDEAYVMDMGIPFVSAIGTGNLMPALPWVIGPGESKIVTWTAHCETSGLSWFKVKVKGISDEYEPVYARSDMVSIWQYPAAHLEIDIIEFPREPIVTSTIFPVTATITNTGEADASEVYATISVTPEGSVRVAAGDIGYTQYIGTIPGHGSEANSVTVTWDMHCKVPCESTITVTANGNDEYGWHQKQECQTTGSFVIEGGCEIVEGLTDGIILDGPLTPSQKGWFYGFFFGDANGLIGPFNATSPVSWAAVGGGPDFTGDVALMGAVIPKVPAFVAEMISACCCDTQFCLCEFGCDMIEMKDVMIFVGHITSDTPFDELPDWTSFCVEGGLLQIINGQLSGSYVKYDELYGPWVKSLLGGQYCSTMAATASLPIQDRFIEADSVTVKQLPMEADLGITKEVDASSFEMGDEALFTVWLTNHGPSNATSVMVKDLLPDELGFVYDTVSQGWYDVTSGYWNVGDLASGAIAKLRIKAKVNTIGQVCNRATIVSADQHDSVTTNNSFEVCVTGTEAPDVTQVSYDLDAGLNLFSLPLIPDESNPVTALVDLDFSLASMYDRPASVFRSYMKGVPPAAGFVWEDGLGYWINMNTADTLVIDGVELVSGAVLPPSYDVMDGWNLIGFKSTTAMSPVEYLAGIEGKYVMIYGFDNGSFFAVGSPGHTMLEPCHGYWLAIKVGESGTIFP